MNALFDFGAPTFEEVVAYLSGVADGVNAGRERRDCLDRAALRGCPRRLTQTFEARPPTLRRCEDVEPRAREPRWDLLPPPPSVPGARYNTRRSLSHTIPYSFVREAAPSAGEGVLGPVGPFVDQDGDDEGHLAANDGGWG